MEFSVRKSKIAERLLARKTIRAGASIAALILASTACDPSSSEDELTVALASTIKPHVAEPVVVYTQPGSSYFKEVATISRDTPVKIECEVPSTKTGAVDSVKIELEQGDRTLTGFAFKTILTGRSLDIPDCDTNALRDPSFSDIDTVEIETTFTELGELKQELIAYDGFPDTQLKLLMDNICEGINRTRQTPPSESSIGALEVRDYWWNAHYDVLGQLAIQPHESSYSENAEVICADSIVYSS